MLISNLQSADGSINDKKSFIMSEHVRKQIEGVEERQSKLGNRESSFQSFSNPGGGGLILNQDSDSSSYLFIPFDDKDKK